ncbi:MAG: GbsR/MarR family transcriptional regulator [Bacteroidota bacterium]|jgi:DNA-binding transcriptional regulator GbsR (MarR family)
MSQSSDSHNDNDAYEQAMEQFVLSWGEMASAWGINRTMAQIHALLYGETQPLDTDSIMERLGISRGNANMNLRSLMEWGLIHKVHFKGSRKDHYTAEKDVWIIVSTLIRERQQREITPVMENLEQCLNILDEQNVDHQHEQEFRERIENFKQFLEMFERFTEAMLPYISKKHLKYLKTLVKLAENRPKLGLNMDQSQSSEDSRSS